MNQNRLLLIEIQALHSSMHHNWKEISSSVSKTTNEKSYDTNSGQKVPFELKCDSLKA